MREWDPDGGTAAEEPARSRPSFVDRRAGEQLDTSAGRGRAAVDTDRAAPRQHVQSTQKLPRSGVAELADSIRQKGLVQPIIARPDPNGGYEIVAGERRWRASQRAGLHSVPVIVRELADQDVLELAIIENVQRADLNAIEKRPVITT